MMVYGNLRHDAYIKKGIRRHERNNRDTPKLGYGEADFGEREKHCQGQNKEATTGHLCLRYLN